MKIADADKWQLEVANKKAPLDKYNALTQVKWSTLP